MFARTPSDIAGGVAHEPTSDLAFFGFVMPSFSRSQFTPSARVPGWQLVQLTHCWKQCTASWNRNSPRRTGVMPFGPPRSIVRRSLPVRPSSTPMLLEK